MLIKAPVPWRMSPENIDRETYPYRSTRAPLMGTFAMALELLSASHTLVERYGYVSLSMFSGASLLLGGVLLIAARLSQKWQSYDRAVEADTVPIAKPRVLGVATWAAQACWRPPRLLLLAL
jgi:hypothetical protein